MPAIPILQILWDNRRLVAEIACVLALAGFGYWACVYQPNKINDQKQKILALEVRAKAGEEAVKLLTAIQKERGWIDEQTQDRINKLKGIVYPNHSSFVFLPGGMPKAAGLPKR